jgi:hypothetical protein
MVCVLYVLGVVGILSLAGWLADVGAPANVPRRWIWTTVIALSVLVPGVFATVWTAPFVQIGGHQMLALTPAGLSGWLGFDCRPFFLPLWAITSTILLFWGALAARTTTAQGKRMLLDGVPVTMTENLGPATIGAWKPRIVLPRWVLLLPDADRRLVLRHEEEHRSRHDAAIVFATSLLVALFPWVAPLWWQLRRLKIAVEMDCDRRVIAAGAEPHAYCELLFKVAQAATRGREIQPALLGTLGSLEQRLSRLSSAPQPTRLRSVASLVAAMALLAAVLSMPHPMAPTAEQSTAALHTSHFSER